MELVGYHQMLPKQLIQLFLSALGNKRRLLEEFREFFGQNRLKYSSECSGGTDPCF